MENEDQGSRLRKQIRGKGIKIKDFATMSGVMPSTLSRFVNGKQKMSDRYIERAAELLNVPFEYLKGETDSVLFPRYHEYEKDYSKEWLKILKQRMEERTLVAFLNTLGITVSQTIELDSVQYTCKNYVEWSFDDDVEPIYGESIYDLIRDSSDVKDLGFVVEFQNEKKITFERRDYHRWLKSFIANTLITIGLSFNMDLDISFSWVDDEIDYLLAGKEPPKYPK